MGVSRTKTLARQYFWWPKMDSDIESMVKSCPSCQVITPTLSSTPIIPWEFPKAPWSRVHIDHAGPCWTIFREVLSFSKWLEVKLVKRTSTGETIQVLCRLFATHGYQTLVSDNGSCFISRAFKEFATANGIKHITSAFYHPSSNGIAERAIRTLKEYLKKPSTLPLPI